MKVVILAGGLGTRLSEETHLRPKPMIEIGGRPILWHIMKIYETFGFNDFIVACGYRSEIIKQYFAQLYLMEGDCIFDTVNGRHDILSTNHSNWKVTCINTGLETLTAGRLMALKSFLTNETFMLTYGDGLANLNIKKLLDFHRDHGRLATITAVRPTARFGMLTLDNHQVVNFSEKDQLKEGWINGGFFIFEPGFFDFLIENEALEGRPLMKASQAGELMAYFHEGFWQPMDTLREKNYLEKLWQSNQAPWRIWEEDPTSQYFELVHST